MKSKPRQSKMSEPGDPNGPWDMPTPVVDSGMENPPKVYLGDSVYADFDGYSIVLTTENGGPASNLIYIDPAVYSALTKYADSVRDYVSRFKDGGL